jgi:hypothetical protein
MAFDVLTIAKLPVAERPPPEPLKPLFEMLELVTLSDTALELNVDEVMSVKLDERKIPPPLLVMLDDSVDPEMLMESTLLLTLHPETNAVPGFDASPSIQIPLPVPIRLPVSTELLTVNMSVLELTLQPESEVVPYCAISIYTPLPSQMLLAFTVQAVILASMVFALMVQAVAIASPLEALM